MKPGLPENLSCAGLNPNRRDEMNVFDIIVFHGSFARTYRGHGTDRAVVGGLLGFETDDLRLRN